MNRKTTLLFVFTSAVWGLFFFTRCGGPVVSAPCEDGFSPCSEGCFNLQVDNNNCGECKNVCASDEQCEQGSCVIQCDAPMVRCENECIHLTSNRSHCGQCSNECPDGLPYCVNGRCAAECPEWMSLCGDECVDNDWDPLNCGNCDVRCPASEPICAAGRCDSVCPGTMQICNGECAELEADPENCGQCQMPCGTEQFCDLGLCVDGCADLAECGGACVNTDWNESHCGACGNACDADEICASGDCEIDCGRGNIECSGVCITPTANRQHCGGCYRECEETETCIDGQCIPDCGVLEWCGQGCVWLGGDFNHCGACGHACDPGSDLYCVAGVCSTSCPAPHTECGESCVNLMSWGSHCGECFNRCLSGVCQSGECRDQSPGHLIAIGHDLYYTTSMINRIVGNSVFISSHSPVRVLAYTEYADINREGHVIKVDAAIDQEAKAKGRTWTKKSVIAPTDVAEQLLGYDVLLVYRQGNATDADLAHVGNLWYSKLRTFLSIGGIVVFLDGLSANNSGTYKIFESIGLFSCSGIYDISNRSALTVDPGDAVAQGVLANYLTVRNSVFFSTDDGPVVIQEQTTGNPIVVHKIFLIDEKPDGQDAGPSD